MFKSHFGWDDFFESQCPTIPENHFIARVVNEEKNLYRIQYDLDQTLLSVVPGKMQFEARERSDFPAVGDWVLAERPPGSERAVIRFVFKRKSILQRKKVGEVSGEQILATNVDTVFITTSVNGDLNFGRLDRYLTFAWDSGSIPVILLTKADLVDDINIVIDEVRERFPGVDIHAVSKNYFDEAEFLKVYLEKGKTAVLVGSSGVGKSTIANFLIGEEVIFTQAIREDDEKGRHSTTSRSMYECIYGGLIIDTPGMRELQFTDHEEGLSTQFGDIEKLITECHFSNCQHKTESNCAVLKALESGELDPDRWKSFGKIARQVNFSSARKKQWQMAELRKTWKKRSREIRQTQKGWQ